MDKLHTLAERARTYIETEQRRDCLEIDGACHENALGAAQFLYEQSSFQPHLTWGRLGYEKPDSYSIEDAEHDGSVHFWVEVKISGNWYIIDPYALPNDSGADFERGDVIVKEELPDTYFRLPNGRFRYEPWLSSSDLLSEADYNRISERVTFSN